MSLKFLNFDLLLEGDLGISDLPAVNFYDLKLIVPHIANILMHLDYNKRSVASYCIKVHKTAESVMKAVIMEIERDLLPANVCFYETDGLKSFDLREIGDLGKSKYQVIYLIQKVQK